MNAGRQRCRQATDGPVCCRAIESIGRCVQKGKPEAAHDYERGQKPIEMPVLWTATAGNRRGLPALFRRRPAGLRGALGKIAYPIGYCICLPAAGDRTSVDGLFLGAQRKGLSKRGRFFPDRHDLHCVSAGPGLVFQNTSGLDVGCHFGSHHGGHRQRFNHRSVSERVPLKPLAASPQLGK